MELAVKRFGIFVAILAALGCGCGADAPSDLSASGTPSGEVAELLEVVVSFSRPMVAESALDEPLDKAPLRIAPEIAGEMHWRDASTLVFVATTNLPASTEFTATVPAGTAALDGNQLAEPYSFTFTSERLAGSMEVVGSAERARADQQIKLTFNQEVAFDQVREHCHYAAHGKAIPVVLAPDTSDGPAKSYLVTPAEELALDTEWTLLCKADLRGTQGKLSMAAAASQRFHTYGPLEFVAMTPEGKDLVPDEGLRLELAFNNPLAKPYAISLKPAAPGFPERCHMAGEVPPALSCPAILEPNTSYTLTVDGAQTDIFGQTLGESVTLPLRTSNAKPTVSMEAGYFVAELKRPVYPLWLRNVSKLKVRAAAVTPANFHELRPLLDWWTSDAAKLKGTSLRAQSKDVTLELEENKWHQYPLDPSEFFGGQPGPGMYYFEVGAPEVESGGFWNGGYKKVLISFTDIGVVTKVGGARGLVWATQLSTGKPLAGAKVTVRAGGKVTWNGTTDAEGVAVLPPRDSLTGTGEQGGSLNVYVSKGDDWTMVDPERTGSLSAWNFNVSPSWNHSSVRMRGFMHSDRGLYRPGDTVHVKGLARTSQLGAPLAVPSEKRAKLTVRGPRGDELLTREVPISDFGGFWTDIEMPSDARLGDYSVRAEMEHGSFSTSFAVEEYRAASFEVTGKSETKRLVRRGSLEAKVSANYFYGAPVRDAQATFTVHSRPRSVSFPEHEQFSFGDDRRYDSYRYYPDYSQTLITEVQARLDSDGNGSLSVPLTPSDVSGDADLLVRASVTAPSNEVINDSFLVPYFRARRYHGIKSEGGYFLEVGKKRRFEVMAVSPAGKPVAGDVQVTVQRRDWNCLWEDWGYRGSYRCNEIKHDVLSTSVKMQENAPGSFEFTPEGGGEYWIIVEGERDNHASAAMRMYAWGDGGGSWRSDDTMSFDLLSDKKEYRVGDTATLLLQTDLSEGSGLVTIERDGVIESRPFELSPTNKHIKVPILDSYAPNVYVSVALVQGRMGEGPRGMPRMRMGLTNLRVRPEGNVLEVAVQTARPDYRPGERVEATVTVTDASGAPVSAEVAITAADEGVLSLIDYETPNPTPTFYSPWGLAVETSTQYQYLKDIAAPNLERPATGGDAGGPGSLRARFLASAVWKPGVVTDSAGKATVSFDAPDNLTAFRVMAVAADRGQRFGSGDKRFTVSKPLQLHRSLPRFLTLGDTLQGGVVVHNETGKAGRATVELKTNDALALSGSAQQTVDVPAGGRVPVLFAIEAMNPGNAELTFSVRMDKERDDVRFELPVHHASPERKLSVARGDTKGEERIAIELPDHAIASTAVLSVSVDPDGLAGIEEGLQSLIRYPYGCLEQTTSKVIPMIAVRELAEALQLEGLSGAEIDEFVTAGVGKIGRHQNPDGGYALWPGNDSETYYTAYALWGLHLAKQAGYAVEDSRIREGLSYLRYNAEGQDDGPHYSAAGDFGSRAFALYVRAMLGDADPQAVTRLAEESAMPVYGRAFLARALAASVGAKGAGVSAMVADLRAKAEAAAQRGELIEESQDDELDWYMSNSVRTTAIVLEALIALDPKAPVIKKLVASLMKARRARPYFSTQDNLYTLLALSSYARSMSGAPPSVTVMLGDDTLIAGKLGGKLRIRVATAQLRARQATLSIRAQGEVHYAVDLRYRQKPETLDTVSEVLALERVYLDDSGAPKSSFQVGDVFKVKLSTPIDKRRTHLMISDRLPAGFEALNARLATVGSEGRVEQRRTWGTHRELRDERADFSAEYVSEGAYVREYMVRVIAAGRFAVPPAVAELMYEPEVHAQTALTHIDIAAR